MKLKTRWMKGIIAESTKPGIEMPWASKRNSFARVVPAHMTRTVRLVRVPAAILRAVPADLRG